MILTSFFIKKGLFPFVNEDLGLGTFEIFVLSSVFFFIYEFPLVKSS